MNIYKRHKVLQSARIAASLHVPVTGNRLAQAFQRLYCRQWCRPLLLICETVNICNNSCVICPYGRMTRPRQIMPLELFEKVLADYSAIGGGKLSLTPMVGEVFLDKLLGQRMQLIKSYQMITGVSFTTNASAVTNVSDDDIQCIVNGLERVHISVYGLDAEEHRLLTSRDTYRQMVQGIQRLMSVGGNRLQVSLGLRLLKPRESGFIDDWIASVCGMVVSYGITHQYANWGGAMDTTAPLPFAGQWLPPQENSGQCLIPLSAVQVFSDGRVSFCPCPDYDATPELSLGSICTSSLGELINSPRNRDLWNFDACMPVYCRHCTFHRRLDDLEQLELLFKDPVAYIGG